MDGWMHICTYVCVCLSACMKTRSCAYMFVSMCMCAYINTTMRLCACGVPSYTYNISHEHHFPRTTLPSYTFNHAFMCMHLFLCLSLSLTCMRLSLPLFLSFSLNIHTYTHIYTHIHTYTHIYTHIHVYHQADRSTGMSNYSCAIWY